MNKRGNNDIVTSNYTDDGEGQIYAILLVKLCNLVAPLVLILRTHIYPRPNLKNLSRGLNLRGGSNLVSST